MWRALSFLTVVGRGSSPDARTMIWFPPAGAVVGLLVGGAWWVADQAFPLLLAAMIVVVVDLTVTGMLHVDGVADAADGLLPHLPRDRRLQVMAEPEVGAFALIVVVAVLGLRTAAFGSQAPDVLLVVGLWCASRSAMVLMATWLPYARPGGLASAFVAGGSRSAVASALVGMIGGGALAVASAGIAGAAAIVGLVGGVAAVGSLAMRRLGGFTGDVLGAAGVIGETCALVLAAAAW